MPYNYSAVRTWRRRKNLPLVSSSRTLNWGAISNAAIVYEAQWVHNGFQRDYRELLNRCNGCPPKEDIDKPQTELS